MSKTKWWINLISEKGFIGVKFKDKNGQTKILRTKFWNSTNSRKENNQDYIKKKKKKALKLKNRLLQQKDINNQINLKKSSKISKRSRINRSRDNSMYTKRKWSKRILIIILWNYHLLKKKKFYYSIKVLIPAQAMLLLSWKI